MGSARPARGKNRGNGLFARGFRGRHPLYARPSAFATHDSQRVLQEAHQYVERFTNYGIPNNNYWDWQAGVIVSLYGFDFTAAYTGTNLSVQDCLGTQNCASRVIVGISKTF